MPLLLNDIFKIFRVFESRLAAMYACFLEIFELASAVCSMQLLSSKRSAVLQLESTRERAREIINRGATE